VSIRSTRKYDSEFVFIYVIYCYCKRIISSKQDDSNSGYVWETIPYKVLVSFVYSRMSFEFAKASNKYFNAKIDVSCNLMIFTNRKTYGTSFCSSVVMFSYLSDKFNAGNSIWIFILLVLLVNGLHFIRIIHTDIYRNFWSIICKNLISCRILNLLLSCCKVLLLAVLRDRLHVLQYTNTS